MFLFLLRTCVTCVMGAKPMFHMLLLTGWWLEKFLSYSLDLSEAVPEAISGANWQHIDLRRSATHRNPQ